MIDFEKEMENILANDPLGLLEARANRTSVISKDDRLTASFLEINDFYEKNGHEPKESSDIAERKLYSRLRGIRENPEKVAMLKEHDRFKLLISSSGVPAPNIESVDDIFKHDTLGLLAGTDGEKADLFTLKNVKARPIRAEKTATRQPCKEFDQFEPIFKQVHADFVSKKKRLIPFESELQIKPGEIFILQGMLVYVAKVGEKEKKNFGNVNARLLCVFENGTESHMLLRSLAAAFWKTENSFQVVDSSDRDIFDSKKKLTPNDEKTGYIYVARSLSTDPKVSELQNLHKIGYSSNSVSERTANAAQESTYLMSEIQVVSEFQVYNVDPQKFEALVHRFFANACLNIDIYDGKGNRFSPREWFIVPYKVITTAINLIVTGEIVNYRYDADEQEIQPQST